MIFIVERRLRLWWSPRQMMDAQPSGEITEYNCHFQGLTRSPTAMANAPPGAPFP